jgi:hypothetical protein
MTITPKNWDTFQHYKNRKPAWIKLHHGLLDDFTFSRLPVASKALAPLLWLLASEYQDGKITAQMDELAFRLHVMPADLTSALTPLIDSGFFNASEPLADCYQDASPEKRREEREKEKEIEKSRVRDMSKLSKRDQASHVRAREGALLPSDDWPSDYENRFWKFWPNKVGKPATLKALAAARKRRCSFVAIMTGIADYIRDKPPDRPWLNPATFLNQNRWEDKPATVSAGNGKSRRSGSLIDALDRELEKIEREEEAADTMPEDAVLSLPSRSVFRS